ncbi:MAG: hypothetical protein P8P65_16995 [Planktotalea sp.]|uniref:hypothetical protein n=1 Tax=Planktotalea sp. TaxID=2029877 RepID=UPI0012E9C992|nr:hypothetical protein [Planktotalea sp.]MDG1078322.1 hypothetical protein [Planktotalea sp.]MDG1083417.1 hypothetical protein [Planktotalea sp.]
MNRRTFTASITALFAASAMPAAGSLAPVSAAPTAASHNATAKLLARAHNRCSPAMLQRLLCVDSAIATELNGISRRHICGRCAGCLNGNRTAQYALHD